MALWLKLTLTVIGLLLTGLLIWFAGPLIEIGDLRPFAGIGVRIALLLLVVALAILIAMLAIYRRERATRALEGALSSAAEESPDAEALQGAMKDALATLRSVKGAGRNYLYQIPWYMIIGRPASGKTTALINSGLKFPLNAGGTLAAVAGSGSTKFCDWYFTEQGVLIDTAGRYTTQDTNAENDARSWMRFLGLLRKYRPQQPINGVIVAASLQDLVGMNGEALATYATTIRKRLVDLRETLGIEFPIYVLFTKTDLVGGFREAFGDLNEADRRVVWGATFTPGGKVQTNPIGEAPAEFDALVERLSSQMADRLQAEPHPAARVRLFGLPSQMAALRPAVLDFLNQVFEPTRFHAKAILRGFYFTSGTQTGTPFDQLISQMESVLPAEDARRGFYSQLGKSFFLTDLFEKVVFPEAGWVSTNRVAIRRSSLLRLATFAGLALLGLSVAGLWWASYARNKALIAETDAGLAQIRAAAGPLSSEALVADEDFARVVPLLDRVRYLPVGYAGRDATVPLGARFGLSQAQRLRSSSETLYDTALERLLRPRLVHRVETLIGRNRANPTYLYEALKVYLMLGGQVKVDKGLVLSFLRRDWAEALYPGPVNAAGRRTMEDHVAAMLDLDGLPVVTLNGPLVEETQRSLARLSVADRAFEILRARAAQSVGLDWSAAKAAGPDAALVFAAPPGQTLDAVSVPYFYTYDGFQHAFVDKLAEAGAEVARDQWVLGAAGAQSTVQTQYATLYADLTALYAKAYIDAWQQMLGRLKLRSLIADKPKYIALAAASAPTSPILQIFSSIRDETEVTKDRGAAPGAPPPPKGGRAAAVVADLTAKAIGTLPAQPGAGQPAPAVVAAVSARSGEVPGAAIEARFRPFQLVVEGDPGKRPIDALLQALSDIDQTLSIAAANPSQAAQANAALIPQIASLRGTAARLPQPFADMMRAAADDFEGDVTTASARQLVLALREQVARPCQTVVADHYPFVKDSDRDVAMADFGRLFSPNGIIDGFFAKNLATLVDTSQPQWTARVDSRLGRGLSAPTIQAFQQAAAIRDAFFPQGGTLPSVNLTVTPVTLSSDASNAKLEIGANSLTSERGANTPLALVWPGAGAERTAITLDLGFFSKNVSLERQGPWSLFRMIDAASVLNQGDKVTASFVIGGKEVSYQFAAGATANPLSLPALREFKCPQGL
ncbi:MAG TPA: type VI secretion system membrane subunit TssM [Lichenihabitans sp.]|jgi:type VI secretion system protein ImpL|nr:type VI secretion system membrane subunit TssM [Lichenihabitans sp.]